MSRNFGSQTPLRQKITQSDCVDRGKQAAGSRGVHFTAGKRETVVVGTGLLIYSDVFHEQAARFGEKAGVKHNAGVKLYRQKLCLGVDSSGRDRKKLRSQLPAILLGGYMISRENFYKLLRGTGHIVVEGFESGNQSFHMLQNTLIGKAT